MGYRLISFARIADVTISENSQGTSKERREIMRTRRRFILVAVAFVLVASGLLAQATISEAQDQRGICIKETFSNGKITDRFSFYVGAMFAKQEIRQMRYKEALNAPCDQKDILAGLEGVRVVVEDMDAETKKCGLTRKILQTDAELRLRQHGIKILTLEDAKQSLANDAVGGSKKNFEAMIPKAIALRESLAEKDSDEHFLQCLREFILHSEQQTKLSSLAPYLCINVNPLVFEESGRAVFSIHVELRDTASLSRNQAFCQGVIWEQGGVAGCSTNHLKEYVRECLRDYLDEFINDYLASNPK
jgi:hypothetical protein